MGSNLGAVDYLHRLHFALYIVQFYVWERLIIVLNSIDSHVRDLFVTNKQKRSLGEAKKTLLDFGGD